MNYRNLLILGLSAALTACGYYREDYSKTQAPVITVAEKPMSFQNMKSILIRNRCLECHSDAGRNRGHVNLESYANVKKNMKDALEQIEMGLMPDDNGPSVSAADRQLMADWVAAAYPF